MTLAISGALLPLVVWEAAAGRLPPLRWQGLAWFAAAGLCTGAVGPWHATQATRRIGASRTTGLRLLDPFFAYAIAVLFLGEHLRPLAALGVGLIALALWLLRLDGRPSPAAPARPAGTGVAPGPAGASVGSGGSAAPVSLAGLAFGVGASLFFTLGSVTRKLGLALVPSPIVASFMEGLTGLLVVAPTLLGAGGRQDAAAAFRRESRDLWLSGLAAAAGTLSLNTALWHVPVPVAVALRNTSPWFTLLLVPFVLGSDRRPGRWTWVGTALLTAGMLAILVA